MIDNFTIVLIIIAIVLLGIVAWLYWKRPRKRIKRSAKPFHPELLQDYTISGRTVTFNNKKILTPEERRQKQMEKDWKK